MRVSGFSSLFPAIAVFLCRPTRLLKNAASAGKIKKKTEILTNLVRKRLTSLGFETGSEFGFQDPKKAENAYLSVKV